MEDMDLSDDLEQILFLLEDNVLVRWRIEYNFFNQSIYGRLFERGNRFGDPRNMSLPEIKAPPNTVKLLVSLPGRSLSHATLETVLNFAFQKTAFFQRVRGATTSPSTLPLTASHHQPSTLSTIRRRRPQSSVVHLLQQRERNVWRAPTQCYVNNIFLPNSVGGCLPTDDKVKYCSVYSPDKGRHLLVASADGHVTVFNAESRKEVARYLLDQNTYAPLDLDVSPNGREFLVSTWRNNVFTCNVLEEDDINRNYLRSHQLVETTSKMGTFSACFSNDATELLASSNDGCIYVYDRTRDERSLRIVQDIRGDINAVRFLDPASNQVIVGGSDNGIIEVWDRRVLGANAKNRKSVATLFGHFDGVTYIDPQGDGRHFLTNSKDQSVKLWDVRKVGRRNQVKKTRKLLAQPTWNYQNDHIPPEYYGDKKALDGDCSVMTYRGHRVAKTLIRARFSPAETTGSRYIYTGCATGRVIIYDSLTGQMTGNIEGHSELVRDVSWHPLRPEIASASVSGGL